MWLSVCTGISPGWGSRGLETPHLHARHAAWTCPPACQAGAPSGRAYLPSSQGELRSYEKGRWTNPRTHDSSTTLETERSAKHLHHEPLQEDQEVAGTGQGGAGPHPTEAASHMAGRPSTGVGGTRGHGPCSPMPWVNMVTCANRD